MTKPNNEQIRRFIAKQLIDYPQLRPPLNERVENTGTIDVLYFRGSPTGLTAQKAQKARKATPAPSRIRKAFFALEAHGVLQQVEYGWGLSEAALAACAANAIQTGDDLFDVSPEKGTILKLYGLG